MLGWLIPAYSGAKSAWSRAIDALFRSQERRPIPALSSPQEVADYLLSRAKYTGNPLGGVGDFYTHPERMQWGLETGDFTRLYLDCDSFATWAFAALSKVPDCSPQLYTLEDSSGKWGHHVVCAYAWEGDVHGVIDTNGHARLLSPGGDELCRHFTGIYRSLGYTYTAAVPTRFPF